LNGPRKGKRKRSMSAAGGGADGRLLESLGHFLYPVGKGEERGKEEKELGSIAQTLEREGRL